MAMTTDTKIEAGHTAGPWSLKFSRDGSGDVGITAEGLPNVLAECFGAIRHKDERALDEAKANARLIAAAPKLKDALAAMLDFWGGYECPEVDAAITVMQEIGEDRWSMQARVETEAKAEGRAS